MTEPDGLPEEIAISVEEKAFLLQYSSLSKDGFLVRKGTFSVAMMSLVDGTTVLGYKFGELHDSFILGVPAVLGKEGEVIKAKLMSPLPMIRMLKHRVFLISNPMPKFLVPYLEETLKYTTYIPGFFTTDRVMQIKSILKTFKEVEEKKSTSSVKSGKESDTFFVTPINPRSSQVRGEYESGVDDFQLNPVKAPKYRH